MDAAFLGIPGVPDHLLEYDPINTMLNSHSENDTKRDERKTRRMLKKCPEALVIRVRIQAPPPRPGERGACPDTSDTESDSDALR